MVNFSTRSGANAKGDPNHREAFFALTATWISAAARIEYAPRIEKSTAAPGIKGAGKSSLRRAAADLTVPDG
jgi:hypothetical protein